jgi:plastocyanin
MKNAAIVSVLAALAACGGSSSGPGMTGPCSSVVNGCAAADYADHTGGPFTITFTSYAYTPRCTKVSAGQPITFSGDFGFHPLSETCGPVDAIQHTAGGTSQTVTFATAGTYGFWCDAHHAFDDMAGAIEVVP